MKRAGAYETKNRGTSDFPAELYCVDIFHPRYAMPVHWHLECEIILVSSGKLSLTLDGAEDVLEAGEAMFLPSGVLHGAEPQNCEYACFVYDSQRFFIPGAACGGEYHRWAETEGRRPFHYGAGDRPTETVRRLMQCMREKNAGYEFRTVSLLWQLMGEMLAETGKMLSGLRTDRQTERVKAVLHKIRQEYAQNLTLDDLAEEAGMAPRYFCRFFRELTGRTPIDYLNYYRVEMASELLCSTERSILDISIGCGFSDPGYFARVFKRYIGVSASVYRKNSSLKGKRFNEKKD